MPCSSILSQAALVALMPLSRTAAIRLHHASIRSTGAIGSAAIVSSRRYLHSDGLSPPNPNVNGDNIDSGCASAFPDECLDVTDNAAPASLDMGKPEPRASPTMENSSTGVRPSENPATQQPKSARATATHPVSGADLREMHKLFVLKQQQASTSKKSHAGDETVRSEVPSFPSTHVAKAALSEASAPSVKGVVPKGSQPTLTGPTSRSSAAPPETFLAHIAEIVHAVVAPRTPSKGRGGSPSLSPSAVSVGEAATAPITLPTKAAAAIRRCERIRLKAIKWCTADIFAGLQHMPDVAVRQLLKRGINNKTLSIYVARIEAAERERRERAYIKTQHRRMADIDTTLQGISTLRDISSTRSAKWKAVLSPEKKAEQRQLLAERTRIAKRLERLRAKKNALANEIDDLETEEVAYIELAAHDALDFCNVVDKRNGTSNKRRKELRKPGSTRRKVS